MKSLRRQKAIGKNCPADAETTAQSENPEQMANGPMYRRRSLGQAIIVVQEIPASGGVRAFRHSAHSRCAQPLEQGLALSRAGRPRLDRRKPHHCMTMPRQHNLVAGLRPSNKMVKCALASLIGTFMACRIPLLQAPPQKSWSRLSPKSSCWIWSRPVAWRKVILGGPAARPRPPAPRGLPRRPLSSAHWSRGGARTRCFRSSPCVRAR